MIFQFIHGIEGSPVNGLEAITDVRQCAAHDNAHGILHIGGFHLIFDVDGKISSLHWLFSSILEV